MNSKISSSMIYLGFIFCVLTICTLSFSMWATNGKDHFASIPLNGSNNYYLNYGDWLTREVQDRDIFYHKIGRSIDNARKADIIILGHSMLMWALSEDQLKEFEKKHHVKIYNLSFPGVASGEFVRLIAKRWKIKPKLWIINADDKEASFFDRALDDFGPFGKTTTMEVIKYGRIKSYLKVGGRNLRWRLAECIFKNLPETISKSLFPGAGHKVWRSVENGSWYLDQMAMYVNPGYRPIELTRSQDCHTSPTEVENARGYINEMGGNSMLILVPYSGFCPQRVREIADKLGLETIIPKNVAYSSADGGIHLDKAGAAAYTKFFFSELEKSKIFQQIARSN